MLQNIQIKKFDIGYNYSPKMFVIILLMLLVVPVVPSLRNIFNASPYIAFIYWGSIIIIQLLFIPSNYMIRRTKVKEQAKMYSISGAIFFITVSFLVGVLMKCLKRSPYDSSFLGVFLNIITIVPVIVSREMIRDYIVSVSWKILKHKLTAIVIFTIIIALTEINFGKIQNLKDAESILAYLVRDILPVFSRNFLLSVLVFYGGAISGIIYYGMVEGFFKFFPFIPEFSWLVDGAIGLVIPILLGMYFWERCEIYRADKIVRSSKAEFGYFYFILLSVSIIFSWFIVGVFLFYPSVILTGSMQPKMYPGDVIIIKKILEEKEIYKLKEGDIINFKRENFTITHRIKKIEEDEAGNITFRTKGDNNKSEDVDSVNPNDVKGIVIKVIPKIGIPIYMLKSNDDIPEGVVN
ncbi:signal peptidase I [Peptostreptococcus canis]|uniref:Signal peptidase I n=1 Tax=Peptostreptococcus canis TaxID=1159213 RepID=A0ABR6TMY1_9FIRM|nr:signal peptidase I [Peptostreptococcus canis]MBP1998666.1 signal peptidase [Peptostreptococcus canis]